MCLDTGHLLIGGTEPAELARQAPDRIAHLHLKDVDSRIAAKVQSGRLTYSEAVGRGMYRPLGTGDVDVPAIVGYLQREGTTAGTRWSRTPFSPRSPRTTAPSRMSRRAPNTFERCFVVPDDMQKHALQGMRDSNPEAVNPTRFPNPQSVPTPPARHQRRDRQVKVLVSSRTRLARGMLEQANAGR